MSSVICSAAVVAGLLSVTGRPALAAAGVLGVALARADLRTMRLPDPLTAWFALAVVAPLTTVHFDAGRLGTALAAALLLGLGHLAVALLPGAPLGLGDVKLAAVLGFALGHAGWPAVLTGLLLAQTGHGIVALVLLATGRARRDTRLPFGPALLTGALAALVLP